MGKRMNGKAIWSASLAIAFVASLTVPPVAHAANSMLVDGTPGTAIVSSVTTGSISASMTTTRSNDILIAYVGWESGGASTANSLSSSVVSPAGRPNLTWTLRTRYQNGGDQTQEIWWAVAPTAGTYGVQVNWTSQTIDDASLIIFAINGANTISPWATTAATKLPMGTLSGSYSTSYANSFILTFYANEKNSLAGTPTPNGVNTTIASALNGGARWWEYLYVAGAALSTTVTNQTWGWANATSDSTYAAVIIDALNDANYVDVNSVSFSVSSNIFFNTVTTLLATIPSAPGKVTFYAGGKVIAGCNNRRVNGSNSVSCNWKPARHGQLPVYVSFLSDGGQQMKSATSLINVSARQTNR